MAKPENKSLKSSVIVAFVSTLIGFLTYKCIKGEVTVDTFIWVLVTCIVFLVATYTGEFNPSIGTLVSSFIILAKDIAMKKIMIPEAMQRLEMLLKSVVETWNTLNTKVDETPETEDEKQWRVAKNAAAALPI